MTHPIQDSLGPHPDFPDSHVAFDHDLGFYRTFPYPTDESLERFYTQEYREIRQESPDQNYLSFMRYRALEQTKFILNASSRSHFKSVIDIGCGCGELLNALQPHAEELHGFETDTMMANHARVHCLSASVNIHNEHYSPVKHSISSDLIMMSHVLEHIPNPVEFLSNLRENSLIPGGIMFLEVPNEPEFWITSQIKWQRRGLGHINYFTNLALEKLLIEAGFCKTTSRECGKHVINHMTRVRPRISILERGYQKLSRFLPDFKNKPEYSQVGGFKPRIYLQMIAYNPI